MARAAGFPRVIAHGMYTMGTLASWLAELAGDPAALVRLQVNFREGGAEVPFVVDPRAYGAYFAATELPGQAGFHLLKDLPQKVFYYHGTPYQVIYGAEAHLQVDDQALQALLQSRIPTEGRRP